MNDTERTVKLEVKDIAARPSSKRPVLVVLQGPSIGQTIHLNKEQTVIGRGSQADLVLRDEIASRLHAEVTRLEAEGDVAEYYVNDLGSTNGTFLNGTKVTSQQLLEDGDKIRVGSHMMKFALLDEFEAEFQERLHQMTQRDELTGLRSRRSLFADLDRTVMQEARSDNPQPISVLMMDLDFFKRVNDGRGHLVGSHTIRETGRIIRDAVGSSDLAARYGGEEFLAYVIGAREQGHEMAEKIRKTVEAHPFSASASDKTQTMHVTISLGVASFPEDGKTALELVQKADQALFRAKLSGRNKTCVFDPEIDKPDSFHPTVDESAIIYGPADAQ
ncbi:MAG TPA: GGDEF domain-containing protein [Blastocatellia bacterium]|nr:GGDEF domain-containing protein [Blastocatellia bacterium]